MQKKRKELATDTKPCLKWAGGKRALISDIHKLMPREFENYYEPFFGGGATFFSLLPQNAVLSDLNEDLINVYTQIRDNVEEIIKGLKVTENNKEYYKKIKELKTNNSIKKAIRFIYLNKTCWNGLYRVNRKGEFNVPFANYKNPLICNEVLLRNISVELKNVSLLVGDFSEILNNAKENDFVYLDPPYTVTHSKNFISYNSKLFSWDDQVRLANLVEELTKKGVKVMVSNAKAPEIKGLYKNLKFKIVKRKSVISGNTSSRKEIEEYIFYNYKLK